MITKQIVLQFVNRYLFEGNRCAWRH